MVGLTSINAQGAHVFLDYTGAFFQGETDGSWMLKRMREAVAATPAREVHAHVESFDGKVSPPGFAAVVLIDESHVSAHSYADRGLLAVDCFTCGATDPDAVADHLHASLIRAFPELVLERRERVNRFLHTG